MYAKTSLQVVLALVCVLLAAGNDTSCPKDCQCYDETSAYCTNTSLDALPPGFGDKLEYFSLFGIFQPVIKNNTFSDLGMTSVQMIDMTNGNIEVIESAAFAGLEELDDLYLGSNKLRYIHPDTFPSYLSTLYLSNNPLVIPRSGHFLNIPILRDLFLESCNMTELPAQMFTETPLLSMLSVARNSIDKINMKALRTLRRLRYVDLSDNKLTSLHPDTFKFNIDLEDINLGGNALTIPSNAPLLEAPYLKTLSLSLCNITYLHDATFSRTRNLENLLINNNTLIRIKKNTFASLRHLKSVDISHNGISNLHPDTFNSNTKLKEVTLSGNPLDLTSVVPFLSAPKLEELRMMNCNISEIPAQTFQSMHLLKNLDLSFNLLEDVSRTLFENLGHLNTVLLSANPLACKCSRRELQTWAQQKYIRVVNKCMIDGHTVGIKC